MYLYVQTKRWMLFCQSLGPIAMKRDVQLFLILSTTRFKQQQYVRCTMGSILSVFQIYKYDIFTFIENYFIILYHFHFFSSIIFSYGLYLYLFICSFRFRRLEPLSMNRLTSWKSIWSGSSTLLLEILFFIPSIWLKYYFETFFFFKIHCLILYKVLIKLLTRQIE